ncbi:PRC-barrel domain-containing protein [Azospirillum soli]|uniref:PRC-barrel domain-containing protein n=1 Tax=Azospirillum soli TaxID=1304799 RepID=UPI001FE27404|nr:PRC-barrel domain-containing protein [Azospirillum soli]MBP2313208.1 sporulation protein YlmC with PRC-barrel domain [Azospirillum soli]
MHKMLITSLSALALMTGAAVAQTGGTATQAPASQSQMHNQSSGSSATARPTNLPGNASVDQLMDRTVVGADGEKIGKVTDVILGPNGEAQLLVVQSGGFLGIGGKDIAVDIALAQFQAGEDTVKVQDITQASVRDMPEFQYDDSMTSLNRGPRGSQTQPQTQQKQ